MRDIENSSKSINSDLKKIGLGGGCHWCTEGVFQQIKGVENVEQGWVSAKGEQDLPSEGIIVHFDNNSVGLEDLIEIHLLTHSSSSEHSMRSKYRSAIYCFDSDQTHLAQHIVLKLSEQHKTEYICQPLEFKSFKLNSSKYLNYYRKHPQAPFCTTYIDPKIQKILKTHPKLITAIE